MPLKLHLWKFYINIKIILNKNCKTAKNSAKNNF